MHHLGANSFINSMKKILVLIILSFFSLNNFSYSIEKDPLTERIFLGNPGNNSEVNLEILCIACHAEEGFHLIRPKHMRKQYEECLKIKKDQNIKL